MRNAALVLSLLGSGCLSSFVPDHPAATSSDPNAPVGGGGSPDTQSPAAPAASDGGAPDLAPPAAANDGGAADLAPRAACINLTAPNGGGQHNAGQDCLTCHGAGGGAPTFTLAGTLFDSLAGTNPVAGATIRLTQADGTTLDIVSSQNGNFYTNVAVKLPVTARASGCPNDATMVAPVQASGASCNGCHASGNRIHLP